MYWPNDLWSTSRSFLGLWKSWCFTSFASRLEWTRVSEQICFELRLFCLSWIAIKCWSFPFFYPLLSCFKPWPCSPLFLEQEFLPFVLYDNGLSWKSATHPRPKNTWGVQYWRAVENKSFWCNLAKYENILGISFKWLLRSKWCYESTFLAVIWIPKEVWH